MAGFGNAVARGIEAGQQRRFESEEREKQRQYDEKSDTFKMYYNTFTDNQKAMREAERKDKERVRQAETIAQVTGFDSRATYELLASDYTPAQIMQMKENGYEIEDIVDAQQGKQESPANEQTKQIMGEQSSTNPMGKYDEEFSKRLAANTGIPENRVRETMSFDPSASNGKKSRSLDIRWKLPKKKDSEGPTSIPELVRAIAVADRDQNTELSNFLRKQLSDLQTATRSESVNRPNSVNELIAVINDPNTTPEQREVYKNTLIEMQSAGDRDRAQDIRTNLELRGDIPPQGLGMAIVDTPKGKIRMPAADVPEGSNYRLESPAEIKAQDEIYKYTKDRAQDAQDRVIRYHQAEHVVNNINQILDADPEVATKGGWLSATTDSLVKDAAGLLNSADDIIVDVASNNMNIQQGEEALSGLEAKIKELIPRGGATNSRALNYALLEINRRRLAYLQAAALGSKGTSLSQREYDTFYENLNRGGEQGLRQHINSWIKSEQRTAQMEVDAVNNNPLSRRYKETFKVDPPMIVDFGRDDGISDEVVNKPTENTPVGRSGELSEELKQQGWTITDQVSSDGSIIIENPNEINPNTGKPKRMKLKRKQ